jgi:aspartyl-tRNA(Asn)/glutamyl-tRNA(Gln) amidotransferase subunit C
MATISTDDVLYVASLSSLQLTQDETTTLQRELNTILEYVKLLDAVQVEGVEPTYQTTGLTNVSRGDTLIDYGLDREALLANATHQQDGHIKVPKVL